MLPPKGGRSRRLTGEDSSSLRAAHPGSCITGWELLSDHSVVLCLSRTTTPGSSIIREEASRDKQPPTSAARQPCTGGVGMRRAADLTWSMSKKRTKRARPASAGVPEVALVLRVGKGMGSGLGVSSRVQRGAAEPPPTNTVEAEAADHACHVCGV